jgi:hypothetical protein
MTKARANKNRKVYECTSPLSPNDSQVGKSRDGNEPVQFLQRPECRRVISVNGSPLGDLVGRQSSCISTPLFFRELSMPLCGFLAILNGLSTLQKQVAFSGGKGNNFPEIVYAKFLESTKTDCTSGFTAQNFRQYFDILKKEGYIKSYIFKSTNKWLPHMLFSGAKTKPILVFGCATTHQGYRQKCKRVVKAAYNKANKNGGPVDKNVAAITAYGQLARQWDQNGILRCGKNFTYHAVSFRWIQDPNSTLTTDTNLDNRLGKNLILYDSGKQKPKCVGEHARFDFDEIINSLASMHYFYTFDVDI